MTFFLQVLQFLCHLQGSSHAFLGQWKGQSGGGTESGRTRKTSKKTPELPFFRGCTMMHLGKRCERCCLLLAYYYTYYPTTMAVMPSSVFFLVLCLGEDRSSFQIIHCDTCHIFSTKPSRQSMNQTLGEK